MSKIPEVQIQRPDRGPDGQAFKARPFSMSDQGAVSTGSVTKGRVTHAKRMQDTCLVDRMHAACQFSDRQHKAAKALLRMHHSAGLGGRVTANLGYVHDDKPEEAESSDPDEASLLAIAVVLDDDETWADRLQRIMRSFEGKQADLLMDLMADRHPGVRWLATVQCCLDRLADQFGYEKI